MTHNDFLIDKRIIGTETGIFVVAEIGINHDGNVAQACRLIDSAVDCGVDAVKFQTFHADRLMIPTRDRFSQQGAGSESAYQLFRRVELSFEDHEKIKRHADKRGILFLSTPFDEESADFLDHLGVPAFKIASSDITHAPLLKHVASKGKPILLSTGMAFLSEVASAIWTLKSAGAKEILLLHCVSVYPAPPNAMNLRSIQTLRDYFELPVGFSDHSEGIILPIVAAALGATLIEKHFTLDKAAPGPDHGLSLDPVEMRLLVNSLRDAEASLGDGRKRPANVEEENRLLSRRSIVAAVDIRAQETIDPWMLACKRPGSGLEPRQLEKVIGMKARRNISKDQILQWDDLTPLVLPSRSLEDPPSDTQGQVNFTHTLCE